MLIQELAALSPYLLIQPINHYRRVATGHLLAAGYYAIPPARSGDVVEPVGAFHVCEPSVCVRVEYAQHADYERGNLNVSLAHTRSFCLVFYCSPPILSRLATLIYVDDS